MTFDEWFDALDGGYNSYKDMLEDAYNEGGRQALLDEAEYVGNQIDLNTIRKMMAEYMIAHPRASLDSAFFYICKIIYKKGLDDGKGGCM